MCPQVSAGSAHSVTYSSSYSTNAGVGLGLGTGRQGDTGLALEEPTVGMCKEKYFSWQ